MAPLSASHISLAVSCLDLTSLSGDETQADIEQLCHKAITPLGEVAAVCVYPQHVATAAHCLKDSSVKVATVISFPHGQDSPQQALTLSQRCLEDGADELDLVIDYRRWLAGEQAQALAAAQAVRERFSETTLKLILESGCLGEQTAAAAHAALKLGADFIKTSTGKSEVGATPEAATAMLQAIRVAGRGGFKASGGVRSLEDAALYLDLAAQRLGAQWAAPDRFRFGASGLLDVLVSAGGHGQASAGVTDNSY